jgi:hypothetical protein
MLVFLESHYRTILVTASSLSSLSTSHGQALHPFQNLSAQSPLFIIIIFRRISLVFQFSKSFINVFYKAKDLLYLFSSFNNLTNM